MLFAHTRGRFHKLFCSLHPTFDKLFRGVGRALRHAPDFDRATSMICALRPTFMKSTPESRDLKIILLLNSYLQSALETSFKPVNFVQVSPENLSEICLRFCVKSHPALETCLKWIILGNRIIVSFRPQCPLKKGPGKAGFLPSFTALYSIVYTMPGII